MTTRLFHTIIVCGAALGAASALGCGAADDDDGKDEALENRCLLPDGSCDEHCTPLADGGCLDPCFVHTDTCAAECRANDGSCGWPPTK